MRNTTLVTTYIQATLFIALGITCVARWMTARDKRSGHLALATGLFGLNSLMGAISTTIWNTQAGEQAPRAWGIATTIIISLASYAFLLFLSDFISFHPVFKAVIILATSFNIVMAFFERQDVTFKFTSNGIEQVKIPGVNNPIPYRAYLWYVVAYIAAVFGVLAFSFILYGLRVHNLARFRMLMIGSGFTLLFIVIGLIPLLIFGNLGARLASNLLNVIRYLALVSAPLLYLGFAPPRALAKRFGASDVAPASS
jgi:hypothetical protein